MDPDNIFSKYNARELSGHRKKIHTLAWSPNGKRLATGSQDYAIRIWALEPYHVSKSERAEIELKGHADAVVSLQWRPGHQELLASVCASDKDKCVRFWDVRAGKSSSYVSMPAAGSICLAWSPDGNTLAVGNNSKDSSITFIDVRKNKITKSYSTKYEPRMMIWGPTSSQLLVATSDGSVDVLSLPDMGRLWALKGHTHTCYSLALDKENGILATGGGDALISIWDLASVVCTGTVTIMDGPVWDLSISKGGQYMAYSSDSLSNDTTVGAGRGVVDIVSMKTKELITSFSTRSSSGTVAWNPEYPVLAYADDRDETDGRTGGSRTTIGVAIVFAPPK
ncbi:hypothetical protein CEUSTIGMA_g11646.t1 [Chlamydomonas eustigma]|uniref:WDR19 first beta-propeller domain-containing protein n=1 Tax=Chlamydomonas eustigma TaxID=1157962 RepID=A0A250XMH0_9CHLO|nr:hypothetical protein CEUSTIGMA_g11646.t1 [Chlamydomonas eustigma]|eukprot:GAX84223.1 hypothetical protein CEUSTIGMA_g11646.t1 [Chlamydomonas eustigma]